MGFVLPNLAIGPYRLEAVLTGFQTYVRTGIVLELNSSPESNIELQSGQAASQVQRPSALRSASNPIGASRKTGPNVPSSLPPTVSSQGAAARLTPW